MLEMTGGYESVAIGDPQDDSFHENGVKSKNLPAVQGRLPKDDNVPSKDLMLCCYSWLTTLALISTSILCILLYYEYVIMKVSSVMLEKMNKSADPCEDFYNYACGQWIADTEIPSPFQNWHQIYRLGMDAWEIIKRAITEPKTAFTSSQRKAADLYKSCMDMAQLAKVGIQPLDEYIRPFGHWPNLNDTIEKENFTQTLINLYETGFYPVVWIGPAIDDYNTSRYIILVDQPVLSLRMTHMYLNGSQPMHYSGSRLLMGLHGLMAFTARLLGADPKAANETAEHVIEFEAKMAQTMTPEPLRKDTSRIYNLTNLAFVEKKFNFIDWSNFLHQIFPGQAMSPNEPIVVLDVNWLNNLSSLIKHYQETPERRRVLHNYLLWRSIVHLITFLDEQIFPPDLREFLQTVVTTIPNRWIFCISRTMQIATMPLTSMFIQMQPHAVETKREVEIITKVILDVLRHEIEHLEWMDDYTRNTALSKVQRTISLVAFPDYILNATELDIQFDELEISPDSFALNMLNGMRFLRKVDVQNIRITPKRTSWTVDTSPLRANAYYSFEENRVVIPAAILAPPIFVPGAPRAVNFGSIGTIAGHELTHAFDDKGRTYDEYGNIREWWSSASAVNYYNRSVCLVKQYSNYTVLEHAPPGARTSVNGLKTISENLADNGALKLAYMALMKTEDEYRHKIFPGLNMSDEQLFFLSFAQTWCAKATLQWTLFQLSHDVHTIEKWRVIGTLHNIPEFAQAFKCPAGSPMNPVKKCENIW